MTEVMRPILSERIVIPVAAVVGAFLVIAPGIMWASNLATRVGLEEQTISELKTRVQRNEDTATKDGTRLSVVETNYAAVLSTLGEIKSSLEKIETRFNLR